MTIESPQVKRDEPVENGVTDDAVLTTTVADAAEAILIESDSLHDWLTEETRKGNLA
ncbi:hypothetical protein AB0N65_13930 [Paenarthrobacter sp. NPDC089322]|uniref:hypothetical protein n=1 Tax=Paenarthrobacter sp. NPDC089322 TaxID=3155065 RepID=UPI00342A2E2C